MWREGDGESDAGGERRCQTGEVHGSGDADVVADVEESNLCVWEVVARDGKRGWRELTNQGGEVNWVKLSEVRELGKNGRWYI